MNEITVGAVHFDGFETDADGTLSGRRPSDNQRVDFGFGQRMRCVPPFAKGKIARRYGLPRILVGRERSAAFPWTTSRRFASGMCKLNSKLGGTRPPASGLQRTLE